MSEWAEDWPLVRLGDLAADEPNAITDGPFGSNLKSADYVDSGPVRVIRLGNIGVGEFRDDDVAFVSEEKFRTLAKHEARAGDLVIAALAEPVGRAAIVPASIGRAIVKADCIRFRPGLRVEPRFLLHALNSPIGLKQTEEAAHGIGRLRVNLGEVRDLPIPMPPVADQRRIVAKLDALRARSRRAKDALDAVPALLDRLRQSILAAAFRGDLTADWREQNPDVEPASELLKRIRIERRKRWEEAELAKLTAKGKRPKDDAWKAKYAEPEPLDESELPELPEGWCWATLREIADLRGGITKGQRRAERTPLREVPYLRVANVQRGHLKLDEVTLIAATEEDIADLALQPGDLLFNEGGDRDKLGRGWIWEGQIPECIHQNHVFRGRLYSSAIEAALISHYTNSLGQAYFLREGAQSTNLASISITKLGALPVPLVPHSEQVALLDQLTSGLSAATRLAEGMRSALVATSELERAILSAAFRGELVWVSPATVPELRT